MSGLLVIGFDPGPIPGLAVLGWREHALTRWEALQGTPDVVLSILHGLVEQSTLPGLLAVESFVRGNRGRGRAGSKTGDMAAQVLASELPEGWWKVSHPAVSVMRKVTDRRLARVTGGMAPITGCAHATAALRHAIFASTADAGMPDPLSRDFARAAPGDTTPTGLPS